MAYMSIGDIKEEYLVFNLLFNYPKSLSTFSF